MNSSTNGNNPVDFCAGGHHGHYENHPGASFDPATSQSQVPGQQGQYLAYPQHTTPGFGYSNREDGDEEDFSPPSYGGSLSIADSNAYYGQGGGLTSDLSLRRGLQGQIWRQNQHFNPADAMVGSGTVQSVPVSQSFSSFHPDEDSQSEYSAGGRRGQRGEYSSFLQVALYPSI